MLTDSEPVFKSFLKALWYRIISSLLNWAPTKYWPKTRKEVVSIFMKGTAINFGWWSWWLFPLKATEYRCSNIIIWNPFELQFTWDFLPIPCSSLFSAFHCFSYNHDMELPWANSFKISCHYGFHNWCICDPSVALLLFFFRYLSYPGIWSSFGPVLPYNVCLSSFHHVISIALPAIKD